MNRYGVIKFQSPFERMKDYNFKPEVKLYKSVILQAIIDASNVSDDSYAKKIELEAKGWLFGKSKDFQEACLELRLNRIMLLEQLKRSLG